VRDRRRHREHVGHLHLDLLAADLGNVHVP
jgi:hypothetical protein